METKWNTRKRQNSTFSLLTIQQESFLQTFNKFLLSIKDLKENFFLFLDFPFFCVLFVKTTFPFNSFLPLVYRAPLVPSLGAVNDIKTVARELFSSRIKAEILRVYFSFDLTTLTPTLASVKHEIINCNGGKARHHRYKKELFLSPLKNSRHAKKKTSFHKRNVMSSKSEDVFHRLPLHFSVLADKNITLC